MAYIILPHKWTRPPQVPVGVNRGTTLASGLRVLSNFAHGQPFDAVSQTFLTRAGTPTRQFAAPASVGWASDGTADNAFLYAGPTLAPTKYTLLAQFVVNASSSSIRAVVRAGSYAIYQWSDNTLGYYEGTGPGFQARFAAEAGRVYTWATAANVCAVNGLLYGTRSSLSPTYGAPRYLADLFSQRLNGAVFLGALWDRELTNAELEEVSTYPWQLFRHIQRRIYVPSAGGGAVTGSLSSTLDALTSAAAGKLAIAGSLGTTLGSLTSSATGALAIKGGASLTLGALTSTADAALALQASASITLDSLTAAAESDLLIAGNAAITLDAVTLTASGTVLAAGTGSAAITLGEMTASATGAVAIAGTLGVTLGDITLTAAGELSLQPGEGSASITLDALTSTATGTLSIAGQVAVTLGEMTAAATGAVDIAGALGIALGDLTLSATGAEVAPDTRTGTAQITLADLTMAAFNAPALTRLGNRRLRSSAPRLQKNDMPSGVRFRKGRLPSIY